FDLVRIADIVVGDPTPVHHHQMDSGLGEAVEGVRYHQDRSTISGHIFEYALEILPRIKVKVAEGLIEHHHLWLLGDVVGYHRLLLLASAQRPYGLLGQLLDPHEADRL